MKLLREVLIIFGMYYAGEIISNVCRLPLPGSLCGMLLLLACLSLHLISLQHISAVSGFLLGHLPFFFLPAGVGLLAYLPLISDIWLLLLILCVCTTILTIGFSGWSMQKIMDRREKKRYERAE